MKKIPPLILLFFASDLALALFYLGNWGLQQPFHKINLLLDLDGEANLPTWYSSMQLFLVAVYFTRFAAHKFAKQNRATWMLWIWPLIFVMLSLDEVARIHEWLGGKSDFFLPGGTRAHTTFWSTGIWMFLLGIPFFLSMLGLIYSSRKYFCEPAPVLKKLLLGLVIFVGSAVGIETLANFVANAGAGHIIEIAFEELGEMIGETFFLWAADELLASSSLSVK